MKHFIDITLYTSKFQIPQFLYISFFFNVSSPAGCIDLSNEGSRGVFWQLSIRQRKEQVLISHEATDMCHTPQ